MGQCQPWSGGLKVLEKKVGAANSIMKQLTPYTVYVVQAVG